MSTPGTINFPTAVDDAVSLVEASNNASSTITSNISNSALSIPIADPGEFPNSGFATLIDDIELPTKIEIIIYTSKSGSNLIVPAGGRGAQGTTAQAFTSGAYIEGRITARHHTVLADAIIAGQNREISLRQSLISLVWASPASEAGNAIEIAASCQDHAGAAFASGLVDVEIKVSDAANDSEPSHTATITAADTPVGSLLSGSGTATVVMRTDSGGNLKIKVNETAAASRYLWVRGGGHSRLWVRSSTGVQQLTFA